MPNEPTHVDLDRFRKKKRRWWIALPLLAILIVGLWYVTTLFLAYRNATTANVGGGSVLLSNNANGQNSSRDSRINVLFIGIGGENHSGGNLADSIMVASIDTKSKSVALLSIPRDLYVTIPGHGKDKINAAHSIGEDSGKGGGPALLKQTVSQTLGIPIHYFVRLDFSGFKEVIDNVGGIAINVKTAINDPLYPADSGAGYAPFKISTGLHTMDGATALKYARSRETTSDFDRARRQQEIVVAVKDKLLSTQVLANPQKVTNIISILGKHVLTDFSASETEQLIAILKGFNNPTIKNQVLGSTENNLVTGAMSSIGASIQIPRAGIDDFSEIKAFTQAYLASTAVSAEKPTVLIENAGTTKLVTSELQKQLEWAGFKVDLSDIPNTTDLQTTLYDTSKTKKPNSLAYFKDAYSLTAKDKKDDSTTTYDFILAIGKDFSKTTLVPKANDAALDNQTTVKDGLKQSTL